MNEFHFIRPWWLMALIPSVGIWLKLARKKDARRVWHGVIADHLLPHLVSSSSAHRDLRPHILLGVVLILCSIALAGPAWIRVPAPFADDTAALVIAVEVTPTMLAQDVRPSRLERSAQKIKDLLETRKGSKTALVAYAGTSHLVMPLTEDHELIAAFAAVLTPEIMPLEGDAADKAVELAQTQLASKGLPGSVMLVTDGMTPSAIAGIEKQMQAKGPRVHVYGMAAGPDAVLPPGSPPAPPLNKDLLKAAADAGRGSWVAVTPDSSDVERLSRIVETEFTQSANQEGGERWKDFGYWMVPVIAALMLFWFRPGWAVQWNPAIFVLALAVLFIFPNANIADDAAASSTNQMRKKSDKFWFQTTDQKAQRHFNQGKFAEAAELFSRPHQRGMAWYRAGEFEKAAAAFGQMDTPEGAFNRGNALLLLGDYDGAIDNYRQVLKERPDWTAANDNLELAKARLARLQPPNDAESQKSMGADDEPDDIVFDDRAKNKASANTEIIAGQGEELSDKALRAMWLRRVETNPADFLRRKFAYQYKESQASK